MQALVVFGQLEDPAAVGSFPLEDSTCVVQPMGQHVDLGILPGHKLAVEPYFAIHLVKGN